MAIYTRKGDRGQTHLLGGEPVAKDDLRVRTYGAVDELQCHLGLARSMISYNPVAEVVYEVQTNPLLRRACYH